MTYGHLQADCLYTGISSGPNARYRVWEAFTFYLYYYLVVVVVVAVAVVSSKVLPLPLLVMPPFYGHYAGHAVLADMPQLRTGGCWSKVLLLACRC